MKKFNFKKLLPHIVAVIVFLVIAVVYTKPVFQGKVPQQSDTQQWHAMAQQSFEFKDKYGHFPLWTNSMFSGMPAYQIAFDPRTKITVGYLSSVVTLGLPEPTSFFFLACICFYFLCVVAGANPWVGILGALAYAYSTFDPIIVSVGHNTQMISLGYAPAVLGGLLLLYKRKYLAGFAITALFSSLLIAQNHVQIVYYTLIIAVIMTIAYFIRSYQEKQFPVAIKSAALGLLAGIVGLACCAVAMMPTYEYAKESMRGGKSELTQEVQGNKTKGGLDKDYAFSFSLGIDETLTFMVPGLYGGSNGGNEYHAPTKFSDEYSQLGAPEDQAIQLEDHFSYWGEQQGTSGPVYLGAIICFLFIFGIVYLKSWYKWWLIAASILGVLLAWGYNFSTFNYFLFDYLPFYNKFRAPTMALVIPQLCFPLMAVLLITKLLQKDLDLAEAWKKFKTTTIITGVILVLLAFFYISSSFTGPKDTTIRQSFKQSMLRTAPGQQVPPQMEQQAEQVSHNLIDAIQSDRKSLMGKDLFRSFILIGLAALLIALYLKKKLSAQILVGGLIVLTAYDLLGVALRYLSSDNYVEPEDYQSAYVPSPAVNQILKDPDHANFRVFNETVDAFNDATTAYHLNTVGGYHPAKLGLYNDIITHQLAKGNMQVFDMLNTKYFIVQNPQTGKPQAELNPGAFGNCWFVKGIKYVDNADQEMAALDSTDLRDTAVVENKFKSQISSQPKHDSIGYIKLVQNLNDKIDYRSSSASPEFAVFSEIYYPKGWNAYIDGNKANYVKTDYVLRGMLIPAGNHEIEWRFEPKSFSTGRMISIIANILVALLIIATIVFYAVKKKEPDPHLM
ncbi:MAG: YfhO family protein [Ginsengibacter sp.]